MSQKNLKKLFIHIMYRPIVVVKRQTFAVPAQPSAYSLERASRFKFGNSAHFFKSLAFVGLAFSCVNFNKFHTEKIKSVMLVL